MSEPLIVDSAAKVDSDIPMSLPLLINEEHDGDAGISKAVSSRINAQAVQTPRDEIRRGRTLYSSHCSEIGESVPRGSRSVEAIHTEANHEYTLFAED